MLLQKNIVIALAFGLLSGCASIVNHAPNPVTITSVPERANFVVTNHDGKVVHSGITPSTVTLKPDAGYFRGEKYTLKFQKEGFNSQGTPLHAQLNNWYWGNILLGSPIGMFIVDPLTGSMWAMPETKSVVLVPNQ
ncbi:hypothetical protein KFZ76_04600 [Methylovulum psychrotolerans]|jgi:uncharacterized protein YceK|uniref:hypothetical protein n=1 Tax=Methylovulum psychrotolerans TaxID=1704499 RepID=UPI001BFFD3C0|nr:hypothetical protein [Methylovulum psychrotolerans]MBT9096990.1 hypothetical protein [Methylovulum psychrotolerans]